MTSYSFKDRDRLLDRTILEVDRLSGRKENGRIYYDMYRRNKNGRRIKCSGICAFTDLQTKYELMSIKRTAADKIFSEIIRTRDNWTCQRCLKTINEFSSKARQGLHCSHFIGRSRYTTRFDDRNCVALCYGCHRYFTSHPLDHHEWQRKRLGEETIVDLHAQSNKRPGDGWLPRKKWYHSKEHIKQLKERLEELG